MLLGALTGIYSEPPYQDFEKALGYAQELTKDNPDDTKNLYAIANLYEKFGRIDDAETTYRKISDQNAQDAKACGALATFYNKPLWDPDGKVWTEDSKKNKRSRFRDAIATLERCTEIAPNDPAGLFKVATLLLGQGLSGSGPLRQGEGRVRREGALLRSIKALQIKPDYWEAVIYKGLLFRVKGTLTRDPRSGRSSSRRRPAFRSSPWSSARSNRRARRSCRPRPRPPRAVPAARPRRSSRGSLRASAGAPGDASPGRPFLFWRAPSWSSHDRPSTALLVALRRRSECHWAQSPPFSLVADGAARKERTPRVSAPPEGSVPADC